jgi:hypothetical protein
MGAASIRAPIDIHMLLNILGGFANDEWEEEDKVGGSMGL